MLYCILLDYLNKEKTTDNFALASEVSLYRGIQLFNETKLQVALSYFTKSKQSLDKKINTKGGYWEAETLYRLKNYKEAISKFKSVKKKLKTNIKEFSLIDYHIGYCHFKLKEYNKAITAFKKLLKVNLTPNEVQDDVFIRLGDSYFATRNYGEAIKSYQTVVTNLGSGADYAQYQIW